MSDENTQLQKLPVGCQDFSKIRLSNALYVDKTGFFPILDDVGTAIFCARPRRFGKSLTVTALEAFYSGRKDLFQGLAAEKYMNTKFEPRPVIRLDMSDLGKLVSADRLFAAFDHILQRVADAFKVKYVPGMPDVTFKDLIISVSQTTGKPVVLLIDEYDSPIIKALEKKELMEDVRETLQAFFSQIKSADQYIHKTFITGISKFSRMGVFSALNSLKDISVDPRFAAFMGITHEELKENFGPHIRVAAKKFGLSEAEMETEMEGQYNGYSFDGETRVYNPFSALNFLDDQASPITHPEFKNYWINSGSNEFIRAFLKGKNLDIEQFRGHTVSDTFAETPGPLDDTPPEGFLYQAGYLTYRRKGNKHSVDYPNHEVLSTMSRLCFELRFKSPSEAALYYNAVQDAFEQREPKILFDAFNKYCALFTHSDHYNAINKNLGEGFYRTLLQSMLMAAGAPVNVDVPNQHGVMDLVARMYNSVWVFEIKVAATAGSVDTALRNAVNQFIKREYGNAYDNPVRLAVVIDEERRKVGKYAELALNPQGKLVAGPYVEMMDKEKGKPELTPPCVGDTEPDEDEDDDDGPRP